jgi:hypothetical protein
MSPDLAQVYDRTATANGVVAAFMAHFLAVFLAKNITKPLA